MSVLASRAPRNIVFVALDVLAVGAGMGVPIFAILLGFPVGWFFAGTLGGGPYEAADIKALLRGAAATSLVTFILMAVIWGPALRRLAGSATDIANFGMPLILFEPLPSFIGWLILMVIISPVLQMLATVFGCVLRCAIGRVPRLVTEVP